MILLDDQHTATRAVARRDAVVHWISSHAWSGDDTPPALRTFVFDPDTGRVGTVPASYWAVDALKPVWRDSHVTLEDVAVPSNKRSGTHVGDWPAKGIVGFRHDDLEACLVEVSTQG